MEGGREREEEGKKGEVMEGDKDRGKVARSSRPFEGKPPPI